MKALSFFLSLVFVISFSSSVFADTGDSSTGSVSAVITDTLATPLAVKAIKVSDDMHIRVVFSEAVEVATVKMKLVKQSDGTTIAVNSLTGVDLAPDSVDIVVDSALNEGNAYTLTTISAVGISGSTITDWALAVKDFITPVPLKKSAPVVFNAPSNPTAILVKTGAVATKSTASGTVEVKKEKVVPTEELPLTGMNPLFLLFLALPLAYFSLRKRA